MDNRIDIKNLLDYIDPAALTYTEWISVGMALKHEGYHVSDWDEWSRRDTARYHGDRGECERKWAGFEGSGVTGGTIVHLAKEGGWSGARVKRADESYSLDWDSVIGAHEDYKVIDSGWLESKEITEPKAWRPEQELITYLETLFEAGENVGYVTASWEKDGKRLPSKGLWDRTAGQLIEQLSRCNGDIGAVLGDYNEQAGAWIRFNPLDGRGCKNENVTDYRYALVESDEMELEKQYSMIKELELPVACLVHSGGKSIHAIVKIEAASYDEYRKRVNFLYDVLQKNGLKVDTQNKNPSRLSRMPGVMRNGHKQFLIDVNVGKNSWREWQEWIESVNDNLPDAECLSDFWDALPELAPPLIDGVLRQGHKMLLAGPSKAGKSFALIELCCAIAEGRDWLGFKCTKGRVMYVNLELDRASCLHRFKDVYTALELEAKNTGNIDIWNLRGKSLPMDKLAPKLIRRAQKKNYIAIVIDPIYKIITGDENSADQMAAFCNQFDLVCTELGCAIIYCHHHSKGNQYGKKSMDRASGSGVFARDPDAMLDMVELELTEDIKQQERQKAGAAAYSRALVDVGCALDETASQDDLCSERAMRGLCRENMSAAEFALAEQAAEKAKQKADIRSAWRIEGTLREFAKFEPVNLWFDYPAHEVDTVGSLGDIKTDGEGAARLKRQEKAKGKTPAEREQDSIEKVEIAAKNCMSFSGMNYVSYKELMESTAMTKNTIRKYVALSDKLILEDGKILLISKRDNE